MKLILAILLLTSFTPIERAEEKADAFMEHCNRHGIKAGVFYYDTDSTVITKKNY